MTIHDPETAFRLADKVATSMGRANGSDLPLRTRFAVLATYYAELHAAYKALLEQRSNANAVLNATFPADDEPIGPVTFVPKTIDSATPVVVQELAKTMWGPMPVGGGE